MGERVRYREIITHGEAAQSVLNTAAELDADVIVMGSQHRFFSDESVVGTTTERVTRFSRIPVLTVTKKAVAVTEPLIEQEPAIAV